MQVHLTSVIEYKTKYVISQIHCIRSLIMYLELQIRH